MKKIKITPKQEKKLAEIKLLNLKELKVDELREIIKLLNIPNTSKLVKQELIEVIERYSKENFVVQEEFDEKLEMAKWLDKNDISKDIDVVDIDANAGRVTEKERLSIISYSQEDEKVAATQIIKFIDSNNLIDKLGCEINYYQSQIKEDILKLFNNDKFNNQENVKLYLDSLAGATINEKLEFLNLIDVLPVIYNNCKKVALLQTKYIGLFDLDNEKIIYYICKFFKDDVNSDLICYIIEKEKVQ